MERYPVAVLALAVVASGCLGGIPVVDDAASTPAETDRGPTATASNASPTPARTGATPTAGASSTATPDRDCSSPGSATVPPPEGPDDPPGVTVDPVTLRPGENGTATVTARNVGEVHVRRPGDGVVEVRISSVELTPSPDQVYPTPNPYWEWDPVRPEVTVEVPVEVPPDADPGTYCGSAVRVWNDTDHDHEGGATGRIVVRVPNASDGG